MNRSTKIVSTVGKTFMIVVLGLSGLAVLTPAASADTRCSGSVITVNGTAGGEAATNKTGHSHWTGRHYLDYGLTPGWNYYYADNDNGSSDQPDTYYGSTYC